VIGRALGHYRVLEKIGEGGMGEVYRARDERLQRDVALKVLPAAIVLDQSSRRRLRKEALALSRLNHPNIEAVYDFDTQEGMDFLVMEYVPGVTLSDRVLAGPVPEKEVVQIGIQMTEALMAAHKEDLIHRDLKPSNLRLTPDGRLKVLDFGLAKIVPASPDEAATMDSVTHTQGAVGTMPYMAPEQLLGEKVDARADLYAAGVVLYELATGKRPFREPISTALSNAIIHKAPTAPSQLNPRLSPRLEEVILKCLEKDAENRYQSAKELLVDLRRLAAPSTIHAAPLVRRRRRPSAAVGGALAVALLLGLLLGLNVGGWRQRLFGGPTPIRSIAVLPIENLSGDPEQEYFADGMTDALITHLSKLRDLRVISRTSVMRYKGTRKPLSEIARELRVEAVVEGTVLRSNNQVRTTAKLIEVSGERSLWAESYERGYRDVLALQAEMAHAIASEIRVTLSPAEQERLARSRPVNPGAHEAYLKGRYYWNQRNQEDLVKGLEYFEKAVELDPTYALAYAGVADSYIVLANNYAVAPAEAIPKANAAALKALEIDDSLAEAHTSLAAVRLVEWDWAGAEKEYLQALELNPGYSVAHHWYSFFLSKMGRHEEALAEARRAAELDPLSPIISYHLGQTLYFARRFQEANKALSSTLEMSPDFFGAHYCLGLIRLQEGRLEEGVAEIERAVALSSEHEGMMASLGYAYARAGRKKDAEQVLETLKKRASQKQIPPTHFAVVHLGLGNHEQALRWLHQAYEARDSWVSWIGVDPLFDPLRTHSRFKELLVRMNLPYQP
jgi:serine/threonine-protein kinase